MSQRLQSLWEVKTVKTSCSRPRLWFKICVDTPEDIRIPYVRAPKPSRKRRDPFVIVNDDIEEIISERSRRQAEVQDFTKTLPSITPFRLPTCVVPLPRWLVDSDVFVKLLNARCDSPWWDSDLGKL